MSEREPTIIHFEGQAMVLVEDYHQLEQDLAGAKGLLQRTREYVHDMPTGRMLRDDIDDWFSRIGGE